MFKALESINSRPLPFEIYSASALWTDDHISKQMLSYHLNPDVDAASRNADFIAKSTSWIIDHFNLASIKKVADFGCGPGLYTTAFAEAGAQVTGIDFSKRSIQYAQSIAESKKLNIDYINQNYLKFKTNNHFDLITMIMCAICALSPAQRKTMLQKFYSQLAPGGQVLLDAYSLTAYAQREETALYELNQLDGFWSARKYYGFLNTFKYDQENIILDKYTIVEEDRTREIYNWLQYFNPADLQKEFEACGFTKFEFRSDVAGNLFQTESNEFALIASK